MNVRIKNSLCYWVLLMLFSTQSFALGEAFSELADKVGDGAGKLGDSIVDGAEQVGHQAGIGMSAAEIDRDVDKALKKLYKTSPQAVRLAKKVSAILVYPEIIKAGMGIGGQHGEGALRKNGKTVAYYNTVAGSYGFQLGAQSFGYALFFMDDKGLDYLDSNDGWEVGVGPSLVIVDEGMANSTTTLTTKDTVYVFIFNQGGLMAGTGIQGSKISRIHPDK